MMTEVQETEVKRLLHDLAQPLTALQCRLYLGTLDDTTENLRIAIDESLAQTERMRVRLRNFQDYMAEAETQRIHQG